MLKYYRKTSGLVCYVSTQYVETVKELDFNRYVQLTWWPRGNTPD